MDLNEMQAEAWQTAEEKGFHDARKKGDLSVPSALALIHSEVTEALEAHRNDEGKESFGEELADIVIRVGDLAGEEAINLNYHVERKMAKNRDRDELHGGKEY